MSVKTILDEKGRDVVTIEAGRTLGEAIRVLAERRIGALVILEGDRVAGILSERDIIRVIGKEGAGALDRSVSSAMTTAVKTCGEAHSVNGVMEIMTHGRFRHVPVVEQGRLVGVVSIGDVVKQRIHEVEREAEEIKQYIATA